jgi:hypothetical protein
VIVLGVIFPPDNESPEVVEPGKEMRDIAV